MLRYILTAVYVSILVFGVCLPYFCEEDVPVFPPEVVPFEHFEDTPMKLYDIKGHDADGNYVEIQGVPANNINPEVTDDEIRIEAYFAWGNVVVSSLQLSLDNLKTR